MSGSAPILKDRVKIKSGSVCKITLEGYLNENLIAKFKSQLATGPNYIKYIIMLIPFNGFVPDEKRGDDIHNKDSYYDVVFYIKTKHKPRFIEEAQKFFDRENITHSRR